MGQYHITIPQNLALSLRDRFGLKYFVETGTYHGKTAAWAAQHFKRVWTIEINEEFHEEAKSLYGHMEKIAFVLGDSRIALPTILESLAIPTLFYLDAHWTPDLNTPRPDHGECPLREELALIHAHDKAGMHVIVIDDARIFVEGVDEEIHTASEWATWDQICAALLARKVYIEDDVIVGEPLSQLQPGGGYCETT
jgi:hypothetical protein